MIQSLLDTDIGKKEFVLLTDQAHMDKVWGIMKPLVDEYANGYFEGVSHYQEKASIKDSYVAFLNELIKKNDTLHEKYKYIFDLHIMDEEYSEDTEGFKSVVLKKDCDVIRKTLQSSSEALNEWKRNFFGAKSQLLFDTFYNMMSFAEDYDNDMTEDIMSKLNTIEECGLGMMEEDACYKTGVLGYGIVSNILNHMYPRVFPGNYKAGIYSLYFLSGVDGRKGIDMPSDSSEFTMVKDETRSKTGIIEMEHNYFYPYETFATYTIRIYRVLLNKIKIRFQMDFPSEYRFLLTNDFYEYVTSMHQEEIKTMTGNDDMLKFSTIC